MQQLEDQAGGERSTHGGAEATRSRNLAARRNRRAAAFGRRDAPRRAHLARVAHRRPRRSLAAEGRCSQRFGSAAGSGQRAYSSDRRERVDEHVVPRSRAPHELVTCRARSQQHPRQGSSSSSLGGLVLVDSVLAVHVRMCFFYSTRFESLARSESHNTATDPTHTHMAHGSIVINSSPCVQSLSLS